MFDRLRTVTLFDLVLFLVTICITAVWFTIFVAMVHVLAERAGVTEPLATLLTLEWFFAAVQSLVFSQVVLVFKCFWTDVTAEGSSTYKYTSKTSPLFKKLANILDHYKSLCNMNQIMTKELVIREIRINEPTGLGDSDSWMTSFEVIRPLKLQSTKILIYSIWDIKSVLHYTISMHNMNCPIVEALCCIGW